MIREHELTPSELAAFDILVIKKGPDECWGWKNKGNEFGYGILHVRRGSLRRDFRAHRVAYARAFGAIPDGLVVCHRCDNPPCTNPYHLFVGTRDDNVQDMHRKRRGGTGKLEDAQVLKMRERYATEHVEHKALAKEFGVSATMVALIVAGKAFPYIGGPITKLKRHGEFATSAKLTFEQVEEIRRVGSSVSQRALGKRYGVGHAVIGSILRGTAWTRR